MARVSLKGFALILAALAAGCGGENTVPGSGGNGGDGTTASAGGNGGGATGATTTTLAGTSTSFATTSSAWTFTTTSTGPIGECDPPAPEGSLYARTDVDLSESVVSMCQYRGDVLLIVNAAEA